MAEMILSAFADEYATGLRDQLEALKRFGIGFLELRHEDGKNVSEMSSSDVGEIDKTLRDYGVKVSAIGSPLGKIRIDEDLASHLELTRRICEMAARLQAKYVRVFSFYPPRGKEIAPHRRQVVDALGQMLDIADSFGVVLCHENEANIYGESPAQCADLLSQFGGRLRAVFDMGNFVLGGYKPYPNAYEVLLPYIEYFHIKDALYRGAIVPAGLGEAQIGEILSDFSHRAKGDFFITLEPHLETFSGLNALTDVPFENPYKYENQKTAFADAVEKLNCVIGGIK